MTKPPSWRALAAAVAAVAAGVAAILHEEQLVLLLRLAPLIEIVEVVQRIQASRDPDDDKFLEVAINGRADVVVSGDGDLLELNPFRGIAILSPAAYVDRQTTNVI